MQEGLWLGVLEGFGGRFDQSCFGECNGEQPHMAKTAGQSPPPVAWGDGYQIV